MSTALAQKFERDDVLFAAPPPRSGPGRRIRSDTEALAVAREVAVELAQGAARRDRERILPSHEIDLLSDAGLFGSDARDVRGHRGLSGSRTATARRQ